jgi:hypothetical protein
VSQGVGSVPVAPRSRVSRGSRGAEEPWARLVCTASAASDQRVAHGAFSRHTPPLAAPHTEPPASARAAEWRRPPSTRVPTNRPLSAQCALCPETTRLCVQIPVPSALASKPPHCLTVDTSCITALLLQDTNTRRRLEPRNTASYLCRGLPWPDHRSTPVRKTSL